LAETKKSKPAAPPGKKKTSPQKGASNRPPSKKSSKKGKPIAPEAETLHPPYPYPVENPLVKSEQAPIKSPAADTDTSGMSGLERIIHFFARHDDSNRQTEKAEEKKEEEDIDPEAIERGDIPMSFVGHLGELRSRLIMSVIVFFILTVAGFVFSDELLYFINKPYTDTGLKLNVFRLSEGFMMRLKASAIAALIAGLPFLIFQVWRFIMPAITKKDRMFTRLSLISSIVLFYGGVAFVYFILMPLTVKVLLGFNPKDVASMMNASEYISFIFLFCFLMGVLFEFPIVIMILTRIGIITPSFLSQNRKWAIVIIVLISAVITPSQDIPTQILVAIPLMLLFEVSIVISRMTTVRKKKKALEKEKLEG
jgi:sec-independent protein translocase protein TatC